MRMIIQILIVKKLSILSAQIVKSDFEKDGVENTYLGDIEKISEEDFHLAEILNQEKLRKAYLG